MPFLQKNEYNKIANNYQKSNIKPDKKFSILPTVLMLIGDVRDKIVLDLGCGDGFFTKEIALRGAQKIIGIDNSEKQIQLACQNIIDNTEYILGDIFCEDLPCADVINSPFVLNYCESIYSVRTYLKRLFSFLNVGGKLILVIDLPSGSNLEKFGAKKVLEKDEDGTPFSIGLYDKGLYLCTLHATYFKESTVKELLKEVGFNNVVTHRAIISEEGISLLGEYFWEGYIENCELGYITAYK